MAEDLVPLTPAVPPKPRVRLRWRWARRLGLLLAFLLAVVWFAPAIVAKTGFVNRLAAKTLVDFDGSVQVGSASLGWFSGVELRDVTVTDAAGRPLLTTPLVTSSKTLVQLARAHGDFGTFTVDRPVVAIVCERQTTNVEHAIAKYLEGPSSGGPRPAVSVRVTDGTLIIHDADRDRKRTYTGVTADVTVPAGPEPVAVKIHAEAEAVRLDADLSFGAEIAGRVVSTEFPLDTIEPFARRADPGLVLAGRFSSDATFGLSFAGSGPPTVRLNGAVSAADFELASVLVGPEPVKFRRVELPCAISSSGNELRVEKAELNCDLGKASFTGVLDPSEPVEQWLNRPGLRATADADLAAVAKAFPRLLHVREGLEVRDGRVRAEVASKAAPGGLTWEGWLRTSAVKAVRAGQPLTWDQPLEIVFAGRLGPNHVPVFDRLDAKAEFAAVSARGSPDQFFATADVSLDRLAARLSQFVDLGGMTLAGTAKLEVSLKPNGAGGSALRGNVKLTQFAFADGARQLREPSLVLDVTADGTFDRNPVGLATGRVSVTAGPDVLDLRLLEPIPDLRSPQSGKVTAEVSGNLGRWRDRIARVVTVPADWRISGTGKVGGTLRFDLSRISLEKVSGELAGAKFMGAGLNIDEPQVKIYPTDAQIDRRTGRVEIDQLQAATQTVGLATKKVVLNPGPKGYSVSCTLLANVNLARLQRVLGLQTDPKLADALAGMVRSGSLILDTAGGKLSFSAVLPVENFVYGPPSKPTWSEPKFTLTADGELDPAADLLRLVAVKVERPEGLTATARGTIAKLSATQDLAIDGKLSYDLSQLEPQLRAYLGPGVKVAGKDTRDFRITGPLSAPVSELSGNAVVAWQSLRAYGFDVGQAELKADLAKGALRIAPIEAAFGQTGKVRLQPTVRFAPAGYDLTFATGKVVDHAKLTPAACADALGYALPAIAKSTETEGTVSFDLDESAVPLADPDRAKVKGRLTLHQVQVGPGPVITEIATLFGAKQTRLTLANEQVVPVRVENGRVYHEGLSLSANGFDVRTTGSVGMDGSLDLSAEVPVPDSAVGPLLKNNPRIREEIKKHRLKVPVWGTISKPKLDARAFQDAAKRFAEDVARGAIKSAVKDAVDKGPDKLEKELEKRLDKIFPPSKKQ